MNLLGIDFEDWYHPTLIQPYIKNKERKPSVISGIDKILELRRKNETLATFFVVGELLELKPDLMDKIIDNGHEIGFHTMHHTLLDSVGFKDKFIDELNKFALLTDKKSIGFRAPTFSLNYSSSWVIDILSENGYLYDSSIVPAKTTMYGISNAERKPYRISATSLTKDDPAGKIIEFPILVTKFLGKMIPAGGFFLRTLPMRIIENAISDYEKGEIPATFYVHSWELTPEFMPKISMSAKANFVTYHNLEKTYSRMEKLLKKFKFTSFIRYIQNSQKYHNRF
jgi:polysaccharide deacetylase family protein (PEP-CTERM system associated)